MNPATPIQRCRCIAAARHSFPFKRVADERSCRLQTASSVRQRAVHHKSKSSRSHRQLTNARAHVLPEVSTCAVAGCMSVTALCHVAASAVIVGACVRNCPQLWRCWRSRSAEGISLVSLVTEVTCYAASVAYGNRRGYAVSIWGSDAACYVQDALMLAMVAYMRNMNLRAALPCVVLWLAVQAMLFTPAVPIWVLAKFQVVVGLVLGLGARMPQIILNARQGHTGTLSSATYAFNTLSNVINGTVAALLTGDIYVMATQAWMLSLNATVLGQILMSKAKQRHKAADQLARRREHRERRQISRSPMIWDDYSLNRPSSRTWPGYA